MELVEEVKELLVETAKALKGEHVACLWPGPYAHKEHLTRRPCAIRAACQVETAKNKILSSFEEENGRERDAELRQNQPGRIIMVIVYKIVHVEQEAQRNVGGISMMSMNLSQQSIYRLSYRKDEPTVGPHPLFAFQDLASAKEHAGTDPQVSIWEAEAPSSEPAPIWIPDPYDVYISNYWPWEYENVPTRGWGGGISPPIYWSARNQGALAMSWRLAPSGTVLCPSITLRRLVDSIDVGIVNNS